MIDIKNIFQDLSKADLDPISGTDAAFLYAENPHSPMHIGGLSIVEGAISFQDFKAIIASRIHQIPKFRQRLLSVPFNLDYPYWSDDPNFDLDMHLNHIALPAPGDWKTLRDLSSSIFSIPLDHSRPLWSITFIEGLNNMSQVPPGSVAILAKIHHVMIDGMSGLGIMGIMYDMMPNQKIDDKIKPKPFKPKELPNDLTLLMKTYSNFIKDPLKLPKVASKTMFDLLKNRVTPKIKPTELPKASFTAPRTVFNEPIVAKRKWGTAILSLKRIKKLKEVANVTINDIALTICGGALRKYLLEKDKLPTQPLVANVPVSIRTKSEEGQMNNKIANILIRLATNVEDPIERLEIIHENTVQGKTKNKAVGAKKLTKLANAVPFGLANLAAGIYSRYNLSKLHNPLFNVTISNVPGPQFPLYLNGHKVLSVMAMAPVIDGLGLIINILSYNGEVTISSTADAKSMPDIDLFSRYIRDAANELEDRILNKGKAISPTKAKTTPKYNKFFTSLKKYLKANPNIEEEYNGLYQFHITGDEAVDWQVNLNRAPGIVKKGKYANPDTIITIKDTHLERIAQGELNIEEAFIQGRIKVDGNASKLQNMMALISKMEEKS